MIPIQSVLTGPMRSAMKPRSGRPTEDEKLSIVMGSTVSWRM